MLALARNPRVVQVAALLGAILVAAFCASGLRMENPRLHDDWTAVSSTNTTQMPRRWRGRRSASSRAAGGGGTVERLLRALPTIFLLRPPSEAVVLVGLPPGADAGSGAPRRRRLLSLGGHGRHGAG